MSKQHENISPELAEWIANQHIFFVATAPLAAGAHINISPKGGDSFRILGPMEVVYQDYTGSGAETIAHLRENGRIIVMFCAFSGSPKIVRLHGRGTPVTPGHSDYGRLLALFPPHPGTRALIHIQVTRVSDSCGYAVPFFEFQEPRDTLDRWTAQQGPEKVIAYRALKNRTSIDGLPALTSDTLPSTELLPESIRG